MPTGSNCISPTGSISHHTSPSVQLKKKKDWVYSLGKPLISLFIVIDFLSRFWNCKFFHEMIIRAFILPILFVDSDGSDPQTERIMTTSWPQTPTQTKIGLSELDRTLIIHFFALKLISHKWCNNYFKNNNNHWEQHAKDRCPNPFVISVSQQSSKEAVWLASWV